jgi:predicted sulfurtransferase
MPRATNLVRCRLCGAMVFDTEIEGRYCLVCMGRVRSKPSERARKRQRQRQRQRQQQEANAAATARSG